MSRKQIWRGILVSATQHGTLVVECRCGKQFVDPFEVYTLSLWWLNRRVRKHARKCPVRGPISSPR